MESLGTAVLTNEIPASRAVTAIVSRVQVADALHEPDPQLHLDLENGDERGTINISWTHDELERLLDRTSGDDILFSFDRDELQLVFDDVEAHGLRQRALIFTVAVAGALGSGSAIANAAPTIERDSSGAASIATVQALSSASDATVSNAHTPGMQVGDVTALQAATVDTGVVSNVHTPGLQTGDESSIAATSVGSTQAAVSVSTSGGEFLGVDSRDVTDALIAGGVLLAIAGATFAGTRRPGSARPA